MCVFSIYKGKKYLINSKPRHSSRWNLETRKDISLCSLIFGVYLFILLDSIGPKLSGRVHMICKHATCSCALFISSDQLPGDVIKMAA